ncbi:hypothetical protein Nepgr_011624 [Nepenthes gracilis]|uniref:Uncharacterized protein n=1 Tax=Nepenthes gracilis TaxID=150966 RepID=A0AAD3SEI1_NEPGR|nr:hypothetical protein Nepgr_011624 [Nepenthes gracilis]
MTRRLTSEEVGLALEFELWDGIRLCRKIASLVLPGVFEGVFHPGNARASESSRLRNFLEEEGPSDP